MSLALLAAIATLAALPGCFVDRKSSDFECETSMDCTGGRSCDRGFCVRGQCPPLCESCDPVQRTCFINCDQPGKCGAVACPAGFHCMVQCSQANACSSINCSAGASCTVQCNAVAACGPITCGTAPCDITCNGTAACITVSCANSCRCDVACATGDCGITQCPVGTSAQCTLDGTTTTACSSSAQLGCSRCSL